MTYGVDPASGDTLSQSGQVMYGYKNQNPVDEHLQLVKMLAAAGLLLHTPCLRALPGGSVPTRWATVPSRRGRLDHPLHTIAENLTTAHAIEAPLVVAGSKSRQVTPNAFTCPAVLEDQHVLLLEDTWTRGATAQSATLSFKAAGARRVSVLAIARWIKPSWNNNGVFLDTLPDYDASACPWTGGDCPKLS